MLSWEDPTGTALLRRANPTEHFQLGSIFPFLPIPAGSRWFWSLASMNQQILSHLPISNLPLRQHLLCQGLPRLWLLLETPFKRKKRRAVITKVGGWEGKAHRRTLHAYLALPVLLPQEKDPKRKHLPSSHQAIKQPLKSGVGGRREVTGPHITLGSSGPHLSFTVHPKSCFCPSHPQGPSLSHLGERTSFQLTQPH